MSTILELDSGYTVRVPRFGPFVFDPILQKLPMPEPITRPITLAGGDVVQTPYVVPKEQPDKDDVAEFELWARHQAWMLETARVQRDRNTEQAHFFLLSVDVLKGPHHRVLNWIINAIKWVVRSWGKPLDGMLMRKRHLLLTKLYVVGSANDWLRIQNASLAKEVDLDSVISTAERLFRDNLG